MSQRKIPFAFGEYYHIYNRGNSKQEIFKDDRDRQRLQSLLYIANGTKSFEFRDAQKVEIFDFDRGNQLVYIGAYCLMPNHFHILLTPAIERGVQVFMQKLSTGYSMYFNKKYERTGGLFEGRFKSRHANSDEYLKYLFSYIHLNPIKLIQADWKESGIRDLIRAREYLDGYGYSSLLDYLGVRTESVIVDGGKFPEYFRDKKEINEELLSWLEYRDIVEGYTEVGPPLPPLIST
jgi:putative transposase